VQEFGSIVMEGATSFGGVPRKRHGKITWIPIRRTRPPSDQGVQVSKGGVRGKVNTPCAQRSEGYHPKNRPLPNCVGPTVVNTTNMAMTRWFA
jgi:hypothetical protein